MRHAFSRRLKAALDRGFGKSRVAFATGMSADKPTYQFDSWLPDLGKRSDDHTPRSGGSSKPPGRPTDEVTRLHQLSIQALEYLQLFVSYGVMQQPLIRNDTSDRAIATSLKEALALIQKNPTGLAVVAWSENVHPRIALIDHIWKRAFWGMSAPFPLSERLRMLRRQLRDLRIVWLIGSPVEGAIGSEFRAAMNDVERFVATFRLVENQDPSLATLVGPGATSERGSPRGDATRRDPEILEELFEQANDYIVWDGDIRRATTMLAEARAFAESHLLETRDDRTAGLSDELYRGAIERANDRLGRLADDVGVRQIRRKALDARADIHRLLQETLVTGPEVTAPGSPVSIRSADDAIVVDIWIDDPGERDSEIQAPWLYRVRVLIKRASSADENLMDRFDGMPVALINVATGARRTRVFKHVGSHGKDDEYEAAEFADLERGVYRIESVDLDSR